MTIELSEDVIEAIADAVVKKMQQPCEDAISRRRVFSAIHNTHLPKKYEEPLWNKISALLSVTPTPKENVLDKIRAEIEQITDTMGVSYNQYVSKIDVLAIIDKYKADKKPTCGDCKEWGTVNCPETYREPTKSDDICDSFKADKGVEE